MPRIVPVIDVWNGQVVRAVAGRRSEYRPIVSRVTTSTEPLQVAKDLLAKTGAKELYVADLDAIRGGRSSDAVRELLNGIVVPVWFDCGHQFKGSRVKPVLGFESAPSPDLLSDDGTFSLDLLSGELFGPWESWNVASSRDWMSIVEMAVAKGIRALIVLDLAAVGVGEGPRTLAICRRIRERFPNLELLAGGGVRNASDLARFGEVGVDAVLIASAIHDGHFTIDTSA